MNWGLGIGDWGLGIGDWGLGPIPNPQSPIPHTQSPYLQVLKKIKFIKYNKRLQDSLNINIIHYKLLNGKLILNKGKDLWKVYDAFNFDLIFEGNYFNGIGKEYYNDDKIVFEGEYINGKKNGYGKEYSFDGKIISEGSYKKWTKKWKIQRIL